MSGMETRKALAGQIAEVTANALELLASSAKNGDAAKANTAVVVLHGVRDSILTLRDIKFFLVGEEKAE